VAENAVGEVGPSRGARGRVQRWSLSQGQMSARTRREGPGVLRVCRIWTAELRGNERDERRELQRTQTVAAEPDFDLSFEILTGRGSKPNKHVGHGESKKSNTGAWFDSHHEYQADDRPVVRVNISRCTYIVLQSLIRRCSDDLKNTWWSCVMVFADGWKGY
jgi:hypothetical protein